MKARGFEVDHSTTRRWVVHYAPQMEEPFHKKKKRPGDHWRLDETLWAELRAGFPGVNIFYLNPGLSLNWMDQYPFEPHASQAVIG